MSFRAIRASAIALFLGACRPAAPPVTDAGAAPPPAPGHAYERGVVDTHIHVQPSEIERLIDIMDENHIRWGLNLSGMWPGGPLEKSLAAAKKSGRLLVATNLPWRMARRDPEFPTRAAELMAEAKSLGARALKIEKALGLSVRKPDGSLAKVDDPWFDPIWTAAGELGLPVVIHTGDPKAFWYPIDAQNERLEELEAHPGWSNWGDEEVPSFHELLEAQMRVVARHPKTRFVSVHFGNDAEEPEWVAAMLDAHPNLSIDLAARLPEIGRHPPTIIRRFFLKYADRILFATDLGVSPHGFLMLGSFGLEPNTREEVKPFFDKHWRWLETDDYEIASPTPIQGRWQIHGIALPDGVLEQVYRTNAERLFGPPPAP
ncbi:MAG: amidohydrolase family protein [Myxococcota bacterium]